MTAASELPPMATDPPGRTFAALLPPSEPAPEPLALSALEQGFKSFTGRRPKARSRSRSRQRAPAPPFAPDTAGHFHVRDGHGCLREELFPVAWFDGAVIGMEARMASEARAAVAMEAEVRPPRRRYFMAEGRKEATGVVEVVSALGSWEAQEEEKREALPGFLPLARLAPSRAELEARRKAERQRLHSRCREEGAQPRDWLAFAEFQWKDLGEGAGAAPQEVREKQRSILGAALEAHPGNLELISALARLEARAEAGLADVKLQAARRARLLACAHAEAAEELVWGYLEAAAQGGGGATGAGEEAAEAAGLAPIEGMRLAAADALAVLAARKAVADAASLEALERGELAALSAMSLAEVASGRPERAQALLTAGATMGIFFPGHGVEVLEDVWGQGCCVGAPGLFEELRKFRVQQAMHEGCMPAEVPPAMAQLAEAIDNAGSSAGTQTPSGGLASLLAAKGGRMQAWVAEEMRRSDDWRASSCPACPFGELRPYVATYRSDGARLEALLRLLDFLGAPTLARHKSDGRYRRAVEETLGGVPDLGTATSSSWRVTVGLPGIACRAASVARCALHGLLVWPRELLLCEALQEALWHLGGGAKLPKKALMCLEDTRLYFAYARNLWIRGNATAARALLLRLCGASKPPDARLAMAWWHLEFTKGELPRAQRVVLALALGKFEEPPCDAPLGPEARLQTLQAVARLEALLPNQSKLDAGGYRLLLSSYHATLLALCILLPSPSRAWERFEKEAPTVACGGEEGRCWALCAGLMVLLLRAAPSCTSRLVLRAIDTALRWAPGSPALMRALADEHLARGTFASLRRRLDSVLALQAPCLADRGRCSARALQVALQAELACGACCNRQRLVAICEQAAALPESCSPFGGAAVWGLLQTAWLLLGTAPGAREARWRASVRAVRRHPLSKSAWLLHLAAWEARSGDEEAGEEEVLDLVEALEAKRIQLHSDPLEAVA